MLVGHVLVLPHRQQGGGGVTGQESRQKLPDMLRWRRSEMGTRSISTLDKRVQSERRTAHARSQDVHVWLCCQDSEAENTNQDTCP